MVEHSGIAASVGGVGLDEEGELGPALGVAAAGQGPGGAVACRGAAKAEGKQIGRAAGGIVEEDEIGVVEEFGGGMVDGELAIGREAAAGWVTLAATAAIIGEDLDKGHGCSYGQVSRWDG